MTGAKCCTLRVVYGGVLYMCLYACVCVCVVYDCLCVMVCMIVCVCACLYAKTINTCIYIYKLCI